MKHRDCMEYYGWNLSTCACESDKHCYINAYFRNFICVKITIDDLVITCDKSVDTLEPVLRNINEKRKNIMWVIIFSHFYW